MDKKDFASQAERYKQEMLRLYGRNTSRQSQPEAEKPETQPVPQPEAAKPQPVPQPEAAKPQPQPAPQPEAAKPEPQPVPQPEAAKPEPALKQTENKTQRAPEVMTEPLDTTDLEETPDALYPEIDLSELETDFGQGEKTDNRQGYHAGESMGDSKGYIEVNVRTGDQSEPVKNASVEISAISEGNRVFISSGITDESGTAPLFEVPAPSASFSQAPNPEKRPYSLYDINVTAKGFFNTRSVDVPVFGGITSVQTFSMVPSPLFVRDDSGIVTYFNQEPNS